MPPLTIDLRNDLTLVSWGEVRLKLEPPSARCQLLVRLALARRTGQGALEVSDFMALPRVFPGLAARSRGDKLSDQLQALGTLLPGALEFPQARAVNNRGLRRFPVRLKPAAEFVACPDAAVWAFLGARRTPLSAEGGALTLLTANALFERGRNFEALEHLETLRVTLGQPEVALEALLLEHQYLEENDRELRGKELLGRARGLLAGLNSPRHTALLTLTQAAQCYIENHYSEALEHLGELALIKRAPDPFTKARAEMLRGLIALRHTQRHDPTVALGHFQSALEAFMSLHSPHGAAQALHNLGWGSEKQAESVTVTSSSGREWLERAAGYYRRSAELSAVDGVSGVLAQLGEVRCFRRLGQREQAKLLLHALRPEGVRSEQVWSREHAALGDPN